MSQSTAAELWLFNGIILAVVVVGNVVLQSFVLHLGLARKRVPPGPYAGLKLIIPCLVLMLLWVAGAVVASMLLPWESCTSADRGAVWLGAGYVVTWWPAAWMARRARVSLPGWYWLVQLVPVLILLLLGGPACL